MRVTKSTPTGSATRRTSHAPRLPTPVRRAVLPAQPTRPPAIVALRSAAPWDKALDACATSPAALTRSTASPVNGRTPRVTGGRTNAEAPQAPSRSGKRKPAYPKDWKAAQPSHTPTGPTGLCCPAGGREGSNVASAIRPNPAIASARIPLTSLSQRSVRGGSSAGGGRRSKRGAPSDLQDDPEHHGPATEPLGDEVPDRPAHARPDG